MYWIVIILYAVFAAVTCNTEDEAKKYLHYLDKVVCERKYYKELADFNYETNKTDETFKEKVEEDSKPNIYGSEMKYFDWKSFNNPYLLREAKYYGLLQKNVSSKITKAKSDIVNMLIKMGQQSFTPCDYKNRSKCDDDVFADFGSAFQDFKDLDKMNYYYLQVLNAEHQKVRPYYEQYVNISNVYARAFGYSNREDMFMDEFQEPPVKDFERTLLRLWNQFKPLYLQYHSYMRNRYRKHLGEKFISKTGPLPACFQFAGLGQDFLKPFPEKYVDSIQDIFKKQNITGIDISRIAEDFYVSLGLSPLPQSFWVNSMFTKPADRDVDCTATSYYLRPKDDLRVSMCNDDPDEFVHEMGHCHYHHGLSNQPCCFRTSPNSGLDESVANSMTIAFASREFLSQIGLINNTHETYEEEINALFNRAKSILYITAEVFATEQWRANLFRNNIPRNEYNKAYWKYRLKYGGFVASEDRSEDYIDAAIVSNVLYDDSLISYFIEPFLQFQIFEATCIAAGQYDPNNPTKNPLHKCNIYRNKAAGNVMKKLYTPGSSQPWTKTLEEALGKSTVDGGSLVRYFQKLYDFLKKDNKRNGEYIGWK